jgi:hypothetical protein
MLEDTSYYYDCFGGGPTIPIVLGPARGNDDSGLRNPRVKDLLKLTRLWTTSAHKTVGEVAASSP